MNLPPATWLLVPGLPLAVALLLLHTRSRRLAIALAPWTAAPAVIMALGGEPHEAGRFPWMLFGMQLALDDTGRVFLLFTALLWSVSAAYARSYLAEDERRGRFFSFFLLAMCGNLGLVVAQDLPGFYLFFALMSFASYGLIVHTGDAAAYWAGRVYITLVVLGELLIISALLVMAHTSQSLDFRSAAARLADAPARDLVLVLLICGFGIKVGAVPLHVWLPLAHPAAPTPASAVLSGAMIKAGLLGWLRLLPLGEASLPGWGMLLVGGGVAAALLGVLVGLPQRDPKVTLAYSSISQMGLITVGVGAGLASAAAWPLALGGVLVYAAHHALAKGALFLGVGVAQAAPPRRATQWLVGAGLVLPALALAGAPLTSGAAAKLALKSALAADIVPPWLDGALAALAVGTTLLMARFLYLAWPAGDDPHGRWRPSLWLTWAVLVAASAAGVWLLPWPVFRTAAAKAASVPSFGGSVWPVAIGALLGGAMWIAFRHRGLPRPLRIPPGDLVVPIAWLVQRGRRPVAQVLHTLAGAASAAGEAGLRLWRSLVEPSRWPRMEEALTREAVAGLLLLAIALTLMALTARL